MLWNLLLDADSTGNAGVGFTEKNSFSEEQLLAMLSHAKHGIAQLLEAQKKIIEPILTEVDELARTRLKSRFR